jgi:hypothetical protein
MYQLIVATTDGNCASEYGQGVIPIGSTIQLKVIVELTSGKVFSFILYGADQESLIEFG